MIVSLLVGFIQFFNFFTTEVNSSSSLEKKALAELKIVLLNSQKFVKAHAAEYLIWTGHPEMALTEFLKEASLSSEEPKYRVVVWRVLVQAEQDPSRKQYWLEKIYNAYRDMDGPDRTHATETLGKLKQPVADLFPTETSATLVSRDRNLKTYALWAGSFGSGSRGAGKPGDFLQLALNDPDVVIRKISSFILRQTKGLTLQQWDQLANAAVSQESPSETYVTYLSTALVTAPADADEKRITQVIERLIKNVKSYTVGQRMEVALALAESGGKCHLKILKDFMRDKDNDGIYDPSSEAAADLRAAAAFAILKILDREN